MAVHFHTGAGVGAYFDLTGADPLNLEPVFDDPALRKTKFVLLHGGWPFEKSTGFLLSKPNVYADFSYQSFLLSPEMLSQTIKTWLIMAPEKVLFATDAAAITPEVNWEEVGWLSNRTGRRALAIAITELLREGEITRPRAMQIAQMVLRDNAMKLYGTGLGHA
nr:amidohydrolase family protein [Fimbriimonas ginsengisoli]